MSERSVLASCLADRKAWSVVQRHAEPDEFGEQGNIILEAVGKFYARDPDAQRCDPEIVLRTISRTLKSPKHQATFEQIIGELADLEVSPANVVADLLAVKRENAGNKLAGLLTTRASPGEVRVLMEQYRELADAESLGADAESILVRDADLVELAADTFDPEKLIPIWPSELNKRLGGGALRGHAILVFARPEIGKTATLINMTAGFIKNGFEVLYVSNEEPTEDLIIRMICRLTKQDKQTVLQTPDCYLAMAREAGYANVTWAKLTPGTPAEVEALVEEAKPDVVVVDQLRNLKTGDDNFVRNLEKAAAEMRSMSQRHDFLLVEATQAGDSASDKAVLEMGDVDFSNTGIPAQVDVMIGVGASKEDQRYNRRVLSLCKNKLTGDHSFFAVKLVPAVSQLRKLSS
jgi:archaellum biogenesis ATPase FlaH